MRFTRNSKDTKASKPSSSSRNSTLRPNLSMPNRTQICERNTNRYSKKTTDLNMIEVNLIKVIIHTSNKVLHAFGYTVDLAYRIHIHCPV